MVMINRTLTNAPGTTVLQPIDNNYKIGGTTDTVAATVLEATKGRVGTPLYVTSENWEDKLGKPMPMRMGTRAEGLRHLKDALDQCYGAWVVVVKASDAKYPSISLADAGGAASTSAHAFGADTDVAPGYWLQLYPVDGDPSGKRRVVIGDIDAATQRFTLHFEELIAGEWRAMDNESYRVGIDPDDRDDSGLTAYLPSVLEDRNSAFRANIADEIDFVADVKAVSEAFVGGTNGGIPTTQDYKDAWDLLKSDDYDFDEMMAAGCYDPVVIAHMSSIAAVRLAQYRFDAPPWMTEENAKPWIESLNLSDYMGDYIHYPYKATDEWYGGKSVWGGSGALVASKAICNATPTGRADVKGAHYARAGEKRGRINRRGIEPLHTTGQLSGNQRYEIRMNPADKGKVIGDVLTCWGQENYLRFEHVVAIMLDILRDFIQVASIAKFEPDGLTIELLQRLGKEVCEKRVEAEALVEPRDPERDGTSPYRIILKQRELDLWEVQVAFAPTGVGRRFALQPILMK